ncbi:MAG: ArnT family glycosyltransferase [Thermoanaerobaculia bacterium]
MKRSTLAALTLLVALTPLISPWQRELFVGDETKYGQVIREMRQTGSLVVPRLEGRPYTHKPPLHFWVIWALTFFFGTGSIWPFVLPSLAAYWLLIWLSGRLAEAFFGGGGGIARFVMASFWLVWGLAQTARMDLSFTLAISFAALMIWRWLELSRPRHLYYAAAAVGVAILIKGPMALVIMVLLAAIDGWRRRIGWRREIPAAIGIAAAIPLAWLIPAMMVGGRDYSHELLVTQNVGRAVSAWTHSEPPWFYLLHYPVTFLPWSLVGIIAIIAAWKRPETRDGAMFCLAWVASVVVPFSLLSSKLDVYMVPAMVPLALLLARFLTVDDGTDRLGRWGVILSRTVVALLGGVFVLAIVVGPRFIESPSELALVRLPLVRGLFWGTGAVALAGLVLQFGPARSVLRAAVVAALVWLFPLVYFSALLVPVANAEISSAPLVREIAKVTTRGEDVGLYGAPHLWARELPPGLEDVQYLGAGALEAGPTMRVVAVRRDKAPELGAGLGEYEKVGEVVLKGKEFDVYRRE